MTTFRMSRYVDVPQEKLFDIVADVERYPRFLPMWKSARILYRQDTTYCTFQEVGFGPVHKRFKTRTTLDYPNRIEITSDDRLFRNFVIQWTFTPKGAGTHATVFLNWKMSSRLLQKAIDAMLPMTADMMVTSFSDQATADSRVTLQPA